MNRGGSLVGRQVEEALRESGVRVLRIRGSTHQMITAMDKFQREEIGADDERVLLLELHNESASGDLRTHLIRTLWHNQLRPLHATSAAAVLALCPQRQTPLRNRSLQARVYA